MLAFLSEAFDSRWRGSLFGIRDRTGRLARQARRP